MATAINLRKLASRPSGHTDAYGPVTIYLHPNGWTITKVIRDWDARGYRGSAGNPGRKVSWDISVTRRHPRRYVETTDTLRQARMWCDGHRWDGYEQEVISAR